MKFLDKALQKYLKTKSGTDLPDLAQTDKLVVMTMLDGYGQIPMGGKVYFVKQSDGGYSIYRANFEKDRAVLSGTDEPEVINGWYLDTIPCIILKDNKIAYISKSVASSYELSKQFHNITVDENTDPRYALLYYFEQYIASKYRVSTAFVNNVTYPILYGSRDDDVIPDIADLKGDNASAAPEPNTPEPAHPSEPEAPAEPEAPSEPEERPRSMDKLNNSTGNTQNSETDTSSDTAGK